jgi:hypothetical protein
MKQALTHLGENMVTMFRANHAVRALATKVPETNSSPAGSGPVKSATNLGPPGSGAQGPKNPTILGPNPLQGTTDEKVSSSVKLTNVDRDTSQSQDMNRSTARTDGLAIPIAKLAAMSGYNNEMGGQMYAGAMAYSGTSPDKLIKTHKDILDKYGIYSDQVLRSLIRGIFANNLLALSENDLTFVITQQAKAGIGLFKVFEHLNDNESYEKFCKAFKRAQLECPEIKLELACPAVHSSENRQEMIRRFGMLLETTKKHDIPLHGVSIKSMTNSSDQDKEGIIDDMLEPILQAAKKVFPDIALNYTHHQHGTTFYKQWEEKINKLCSQYGFNSIFDIAPGSKSFPPGSKDLHDDPKYKLLKSFQEFRGLIYEGHGLNVPEWLLDFKSPYMAAGGNAHTFNAMKQRTLATKLNLDDRKCFDIVHGGFKKFITEWGFSPVTPGHNDVSEMVLNMMQDNIALFKTLAEKRQNHTTASREALFDRAYKKLKKENGEYFFLKYATPTGLKVMARENGGPLQATDALRDAAKCELDKRGIKTAAQEEYVQQLTEKGINNPAKINEILTNPILARSGLAAILQVPMIPKELKESAYPNPELIAVGNFPATLKTALQIQQTGKTPEPTYGALSQAVSDGTEYTGQISQDLAQEYFDEASKETKFRILKDELKILAEKQPKKVQNIPEELLKNFTSFWENPKDTHPEKETFCQEALNDLIKTTMAQNGSTLANHLEALQEASVDIAEEEIIAPASATTARASNTAPGKRSFSSSALSPEEFKKALRKAGIEIAAEQESPLTAPGKPLSSTLPANKHTTTTAVKEATPYSTPHHLRQITSPEAGAERGA